MRRTEKNTKTDRVWVWTQDPRKTKQNYNPSSAGCSSILFNCSTLHVAVCLRVSYPQPSTRPAAPSTRVIVTRAPLCFRRFTLIMHHYCKWTKRHAAFQELLDVAALQVLYRHSAALHVSLRLEMQVFGLMKRRWQTRRYWYLERILLCYLICVQTWSSCYLIYVHM